MLCLSFLQLWWLDLCYRCGPMNNNQLLSLFFVFQFQVYSWWVAQGMRTSFLIDDRFQKRLILSSRNYPTVLSCWKCMYHVIHQIRTSVLFNINNYKNFILLYTIKVSKSKEKFVHLNTTNFKNLISVMHICI